MSYCNSVLDLIEGQAIINKDKIAFTDPAKEISFGQLYLFSRKIGMFLAGRIEKRSPVSFYMEKSCDAVVGMFGAVYAGGFYSFLDVRQPVVRAEAMWSVRWTTMVVHLIRSEVMAGTSWGEGHCFAGC